MLYKSPIALPGTPHKLQRTAVATADMTIRDSWKTYLATLQVKLKQQVVCRQKAGPDQGVAS